MAYHLKPATVLTGKSAQRFTSIVMSTRKGTIDFSHEKEDVQKILDNSKTSIF